MFFCHIKYYGKISWKDLTNKINYLPSVVWTVGFSRRLQWREEKDAVLCGSQSTGAAGASGDTQANWEQIRLGNANAQRKKRFCCRVTAGCGGKKQYWAETAKERVRTSILQSLNKVLRRIENRSGFFGMSSIFRKNRGREVYYWKESIYVWMFMMRF